MTSAATTFCAALSGRERMARTRRAVVMSRPGAIIVDPAALVGEMEDRSAPGILFVGDYRDDAELVNAVVEFGGHVFLATPCSLKSHEQKHLDAASQESGAVVGWPAPLPTLPEVEDFVALGPAESIRIHATVERVDPRSELYRLVGAAMALAGSNDARTTSLKIGRAGGSDVFALHATVRFANGTSCLISCEEGEGPPSLAIDTWRGSARLRMILDGQDGGKIRITTGAETETGTARLVYSVEDAAERETASFVSAALEGRGNWSTVEAPEVFALVERLLSGSRN